MTLYMPHSVEIDEMEAWKVVARRDHPDRATVAPIDRYVTPWAVMEVKIGVLTTAVEREGCYGFHAYVKRADAMTMIETYYMTRWIAGQYYGVERNGLALARVMLWGVFQRGGDGTIDFESRKYDAVVAREMRVEEIIPRRDVRYSGASGVGRWFVVVD